MQVKRILETDAIAKVMAIYPETPMNQNRVDLEKIHRAMDAANIFGSLHMKILADLSPIELMYLIETNHKIYYSTQGWVVPLHFVEVAFNVPDIMIAAAYEGADIEDIYNDTGILTMIGNSISQDAQKRFLDNGHINTWHPTPNPSFDGWDMMTIEFDACHETIAPINPITKYQIGAMERFEQRLREYVGAHHGDEDFEVKFNATYSKYVTIHEFFDIAASGKATITNINYGIRQLIKDGYIPQDLYSITSVNNVLGNPQEHVSGDSVEIEKLMAADKCWFNVVLTDSISYHINDVSGNVRIGWEINNFDHYLRSVMDDNIRELVPDYKWNGEGNVAEEIKVPAPPSVLNVVAEIITAVAEDNTVPADVTQHIFDDKPVEESTPSDDDDDNFSLLGDVNKAFDSFKEAINDVAVPETHNDTMEPQSDSILDEDTPAAPATKSVGTYLGTLAFVITNGSFNSIKMIEDADQYYVENIRGVVCAEYGPDKMPGIYYLGRPQFTDGADARYKWDILSLDKLFRKSEIPDGYFKVVHWYNPDGSITENVEWWGSQEPTEARHETSNQE